MEKDQNKEDIFVICFFDIANKEKKILIKYKGKPTHIEEEKSTNYFIEYFNFLKNDKHLFVNFKIKYNFFISNPCAFYNGGDLSAATREYIDVGYVFSLSRENYLECEYEFLPRDNRTYILCNYYNDLFIAIKNAKSTYGDKIININNESRNAIKGELYLFKFEDKTFKIYKSLPFSEKYEFKKLKNNNLIVYSLNELRLFKLIK